MNVIFLQHDPLLPPGELERYLIRRQQANTRVLHSNETREDHPAIGAADLIVSLGSTRVGLESVSSNLPTDIEWIEREWRILSRAIARGVPYLGICFGAQLLALITGGRVQQSSQSYVGWIENDHITAPVWKGPWFRCHREFCEVPGSTEVLASSGGILQAFQDGRCIGLQFHPEIDASTVQNLLPGIRAEFGSDTKDLQKLTDDTKIHVMRTVAAREVLLDEVLARIIGSRTSSAG